MSTNPGIQEPVSAEVASVKQSDAELELARLQSDLHTKAHASANRAEGLATAANQTAASTAMEIGARLGGVEDWRKGVTTDISQINARLGTIEAAVKRSPYLQFLYALTTVVVLLYYAGELIDKYFPAGGR